MNEMNLVRKCAKEMMCESAAFRAPQNYCKFHNIQMDPDDYSNIIVSVGWVVSNKYPIFVEAG